MNAADTSEPAFPVITKCVAPGEFGHQAGSTTWQFPGMTLRDYFAAKAMQGGYAGYNGNPPEPERVAEDAYVIADAMIKARQS